MDNAQTMLDLVADHDLTFTDFKVLHVLQAVQDPAGISHATAQQIAQHIGSHRPTITLALQHLAAKGLITGGRGQYKVLSFVTESMSDARNRRRVQMATRTRKTA